MNPLSGGAIFLFVLQPVALSLARLASPVRRHRAKVYRKKRSDVMRKNEDTDIAAYGDLLAG
jgi:hypothetical protein